MIGKLIGLLLLVSCALGHAACEDLLSFLASADAPPVWTPRRPPPLDPQRTYFVQLTYFKPSEVDIDEQTRLALDIRRTLFEAKGHIAHQVYAHLPTRQFWTLSVWESREAMWEFYSHPTHGQAMQRYRGRIEEKAFPGREIHGLSGIPQDISFLVQWVLEAPTGSDSAPKDR